MHKKLFIPGPIEISPEILDALTTPMIGHRMPEYARLHQGVTDKLKKLMFTEDRVFLSTSSAFGAMEGAVRNLVGKRCANFCNGAFSDKWHNVTLACGKEADAFKVNWGEPITPELVDEALATGKYDAITLIHNETSTGVMSPLPEIAQVLKKYPDVLSIVDTVSSMSALKIPVAELGIDCCVFGVQKAFALPPGLAVFTASERALERAKEVPGRGYYFDFLEFAAADEKDNTPSTPPSRSSSPWTGSWTGCLRKGWRTDGRGTRRWPSTPGGGCRSRASACSRPSLTARSPSPARPTRAASTWHSSSSWASAASPSTTATARSKGRPSASPTWGTCSLTI